MAIRLHLDGEKFDPETIRVMGLAFEMALVALRPDVRSADPEHDMVTGGDQLDESSYPILLAWQSGLARDDDLWPKIRAAADFVVAHGPSFGSERWEEQGGFSPSTIAAEIAGLVAAARIAHLHGDDEAARVYRSTADHFQRSIKGWSVTTNGQPTPSTIGRYTSRIRSTARCESDPTTTRSGWSVSCTARPSRRNSGFDATSNSASVRASRSMVRRIHWPVSTGTVDFSATTV